MQLSRPGQHNHQANHRGMRVDYDTLSHKVSGILTKKSAKSIHDQGEARGEIALTHFSESRMWPGPQVEEVWIAEQGHFTNWTETDLEPHKYAHMTEDEQKKRMEKDEEEKENMSKRELEALEEEEMSKEVKFEATIEGSKIYQQQGMPRRSP